MAWLARTDFAYANALSALERVVWRRDERALELRYRELMAAVILGCRADHAIEAHLRRALAAGATLRELVEAFEVAAILGGFPAIHHALPYFSRLHQEFGDVILGEVPPPPDGVVATVAKGPAVSRGMSEWAWLDQIDPAYEQAHQNLTRLVWTPTAPVLPVKVRELVACVVLAYRSFPTLDGHLRRAVREGASVREAVEAMQAAAMPGGFPLIHFALPYLSKLHDEIEAGAFR
jgi:alkylhydroperoxidase/carboxymuconolactone decarboxylase family protein YurZ